VQGYFSMNVVPGTVTVYIDLNNYQYYEIELVLNPNDNLQVDIYLDKL
jgi:hypothetical protein